MGGGILKNLHSFNELCPQPSTRGIEVGSVCPFWTISLSTQTTVSSWENDEKETLRVRLSVLKSELYVDICLRLQKQINIICKRLNKSWECNVLFGRDIIVFFFIFLFSFCKFISCVISNEWTEPPLWFPSLGFVALRLSVICLVVLLLSLDPNWTVHFLHEYCSGLHVTHPTQNLVLLDGPT